MVVMTVDIGGEVKAGGRVRNDLTGAKDGLKILIGVKVNEVARRNDGKVMRTLGLMATRQVGMSLSVLHETITSRIGMGLVRNIDHRRIFGMNLRPAVSATSIPLDPMKKRGPLGMIGKSANAAGMKKGATNMVGKTAITGQSSAGKARGHLIIVPKLQSARGDDRSLLAGINEGAAPRRPSTSAS